MSRVPGRHANEHQMRLFYEASKHPCGSGGGHRGLYQYSYRIRIGEILDFHPISRRGSGGALTPCRTYSKMSFCPSSPVAPGVRTVVIFEVMRPRRPGLNAGIRLTLDRRVRACRAIHGHEQQIIFR